MNSVTGRPIFMEAVEKMTHQQRQLQTLLQGIDVRRIAGDASLPVSGISYDSRKVNPGDLFVAIPGLLADGHQFIEQAAAQGAVAAVVSQPVEKTRLKAIVEVDSTRRALAILAANYFDHPSRELSLIGITGTNGKTTLTYLLEQIFFAAGRVPGIIGTVGARYPGFELTMGHTTPEAPELQQLFCQMIKAGVNISAMEVSSHALDLERTRGCHFRLAVFINLSRDHLDYHADLDEYAQAKSLLFSRELNDSRAEKKVAVVNSDDQRCTKIIEGWYGETLSFGFDATADVHPLGEMHNDLDGFRSDVAYPGGQLEVIGRMPGRHNLQNALAAVAVSIALEIDVKFAAAGIAACHVVPGRLQRVTATGGPAVFVDYAHTDHALTNVLAALRPLTRGRLLVVFGCGGDRDRGKRPLMGQAVAKGADLAVVTSDNPRTEEPNAIIEQILPGLDQEGFVKIPAEQLARQESKRYAVVPDRREAINMAVGLATEQDVVLIAGKGHENYQIIGTMRTHFDDCDEAERALLTWVAGGIQ